MKKTVDIIKKLAQTMPGRPAAKKRNIPSQPNATTPSKHVSPTGSMPVRNRGNVAPSGQNFIPQSSALPAVKELQKAILNFATVASAIDLISLEGNQQGQQYGQQSRAIPFSGPNNPTYDSSKPESAQNSPLPNNPDDEKEYLGGTDPFNNFLINNYVMKDSNIGKQYLNTDINKNKELASNTPISLRGLIDSIKKIGTPGSSESVDGIWQTRTNNALHLISGLASSMLIFTHDMGLSIKGITFDQLNAFKKELPENYTELKNPQEVKDKAEKLIPYISAITDFFKNLKPAVFDNKQLREHIDQKTPFVKYEKAINPLDFGAGAMFDNIPINIRGQNTTISLNDLVSLDNFKKYVNKLIGGSPEASQFDEAYSKILDSVVTGLGGPSQTLGF